VNQAMQTGSTNIVVPSMIDKNPIEDTIIKIAPVIVNKNTVDESEKDDCEKIYQSDTDQQNCIDNFFIKKAITSKDESICSMVSSIVLQDNCKDNVLFQEISTKNDPTLCTQLRNLDTVGNCFAIVGKQAQKNNTTE
jgi:hypothetical protein